MLERFNIRPKKMRRLRGQGTRGYKRRWFEPVWERYLDARSEEETEHAA